jgi:hypothetical protein
VVDGDSGAVLNSQNVSGFSGGVYLSWDVSGHVKFNLTSANVNAVASGIFFGGASGGGTTTQTAATPTISPNGGSYTSAQTITLATTTSGAQIRYTLNGTDPTSSSTLYSGPFSLSSSATVKAKAFATGMNASATASAAFTISTGGTTTGGQFVFVGGDYTTRGDWRGVYGADGYNVIGSSFKYPSYMQVTPSGKSDWVWNATTIDARALSTADGSSREAGCFYSSTGFTIDFRITDGATHRVAIYLCDWDSANRSQTVELLNGDTGAVLQSQTISGFSRGQYLIWDVKGHVQLRFTRLAGPNAIVNGLFFQPAAKQL